MTGAIRRGPALAFAHAALALAASAAVLASCSGGEQRAAAAAKPEGSLEVLDLEPGFSPKDLPENWIAEGPSDVIKNQMTVALKDGVKSLKVANSKDGFIVVRRTKAMLLATPYLSWAWNMAPHGEGTHPVSLVAGFKGGARNGGSSFTRPGSSLPPHDRALAINWSDSALQRGSLAKPAAGALMVPVYTARGGRENADSWWIETVDLSWLYSKLWPGDNPGSAAVAFIGVAVAGGRPPAAAYISEIKLSR